MTLRLVRELAGDSDERTFLGIGTATLHVSETPVAQVGIWSPPAEDVVGTLRAVNRQS